LAVVSVLSFWYQPVRCALPWKVRLSSGLPPATALTPTGSVARLPFTSLSVNAHVPVACGATVSTCCAIEPVATPVQPVSS
jgi:hypothetical protein